MLDLRAHATQWAPGLAGTRVLVGGAPAQHYDFDKLVYDEFPLLLGLSLLVTFVILMLFFHSLVLPLKAILLNLISLAASYGVLVLVFQFGIGDFLLGFHSLGALLSYTPVLLFSILFGLSTDYEVFLLTRVREYVRQGYSNEESVALGLDHTAGIITAAGADHDRRLRLVRADPGAGDQGAGLRAGGGGAARHHAGAAGARAGDDEADGQLELVDAARPGSPGARDRRGRRAQSAPRRAARGRQRRRPWIARNERARQPRGAPRPCRGRRGRRAFRTRSAAA